MRGNYELSKRWFDIYDRDKSGYVDFKELATLLSSLVKGTPEVITFLLDLHLSLLKFIFSKDRLSVVFSFYDVNGDGSLTKGIPTTLFYSGPSLILFSFLSR